MRGKSVALSFALLFCGAGEAFAQRVDVQHFEPATTPAGMATVKGGSPDGSMVPTLTLTTIYIRDPLVARAPDGKRVATLIRDRVDLVLTYAMGLSPGPLSGVITGIDIGAIVPFVPYQRLPTSASGGELEKGKQNFVGMADPKLQARFGLLTSSGAGIDLALIPVVSFPLAGGRYLGSTSVVFTPELAASRNIGPVLLAANVGYRVRGNESIAGMQVNDQVTWRAGAALDLHAMGAGHHSYLGLEAFGLTRGSRPFRAVRQSPTEVLASGRYRVSEVLVSAGVGMGLNQGYGSPAVRTIAGLAWAPRLYDRDGDGIDDEFDQCIDDPEDLDGIEDNDGCPELDNDGDGLLDDDDACPDDAEDVDNFADDDGCPDLDNDGDKVLDLADGCPLEPEDLDGFEDEDGCPDLDNDQDAVPDLRDKCPLEPEDVDGFEDGDGCPDPDNDKDGFLDGDDACPLMAEDMNDYKDDDGCPDAKDDKDGDGLSDREDNCPTEPEDLDGFEDEDGCPDLDNDKDDVPDSTDSCPLEAEDKDGFMDEDGCPELDNDGDGIGDADDKCPNESEVINGVDDDDGCPDEGAQLVRLTAEKIEIRERVLFESGSDVIDSRSFELLDQVVSVLENHKEIEKVSVEGHTDDRGSEAFNLDLSQRRAGSVKRYLIEKGVAPDRVEFVGFGEEKPIASNKTARGREMNRRVEFTIGE